MTPTEKLRWRAQHGAWDIGQNELARQAGVTPSTLSRFLHGRVIKSDIFDALSAVIDEKWPETAENGSKVPKVGYKR